MKILNLQNKSFFITAKEKIESMADKEIKIEEFEKIGYEYNPYWEVLLETVTIDLPYDFILYCMLKEE